MDPPPKFWHLHWTFVCLGSQFFFLSSFPFVRSFVLCRFTSSRSCAASIANYTQQIATLTYPKKKVPLDLTTYLIVIVVSMFANCCRVVFFELPLSFSGHLVAMFLVFFACWFFFGELQQARQGPIHLMYPSVVIVSRLLWLSPIMAFETNTDKNSPNN